MVIDLIQDDWQKEKRDFLQSLNRISSLPRTSMTGAGSGGPRTPQIVSSASSPQVSYGPSGMELTPASNKPILEKKASAYGEVVKNLNSSRERGLPFKVMQFHFVLIRFIIWLPIVIGNNLVLAISSPLHLCLLDMYLNFLDLSFFLFFDFEGASWLTWCCHVMVGLLKCVFTICLTSSICPHSLLQLSRLLMTVWASIHLGGSQLVCKRYGTSSRWAGSILIFAKVMN